MATAENSEAMRGGYRWIVHVGEFAAEQFIELQVEGQGNRYLY